MQRLITIKESQAEYQIVNSSANILSMKNNPQNKTSTISNSQSTTKKRETSREKSSSSISHSKSKIRDYAMNNNWEYTFTLTVSPECIIKYGNDYIASLRESIHTIRKKHKEIKFLFIMERYRICLIPTSRTKNLSSKVSGSSNIRYTRIYP